MANIDNKPKGKEEFDAKKLAQKVTEAIQAVSDAATQSTERTAAEAIKSVKTVTSAKSIAMKHAGDVVSSPYVKISPESIEKMSATMFPPSLVHPLLDVAKEETQNKVAIGVKNLADSIMNMDKGKDGVYSLSSPEILHSLEDLRKDNDTKLGEVVKRLDKVEGNTNPLLKVYDLFLEYGKDVWDLLINSKSANKLTNQLVKAAKINQNIQLAWMEKDTINAARGQSEGGGKLHAKMFEDPKKGFFEKLARMIVPDESTTDKAIKNMTTVAGFFGAVGGVAGAGMVGLINGAMKYLVGGASSLIGLGIGALGEFLGVVGSVLGVVLGPIGTAMSYLVGGPTGLLFRGISTLVGFIGGSAVIMGGIVALLVGSAVYDLILHPEKLLAYGTAFANLWGGIMQVFDALIYALSPITKALWDWWTGPGESGFAKLGGFVNDTIIFLLGTTLPAMLKGFADLIVVVSDGIASVYNSIAGIFGYGPNASQGFFGNVINLVTGLGTMLVQMTDTLLTSLIAGLGLSSLFGMDANTSFFGAMNNAINNLGTWLVNSMTNIAANINTSFNHFTDWVISTISTTIDSTIVKMGALFDKFNPLPKIEEWITKAVDFILGLFPSIDDMKAFMMKMLNKLPGSAAAAWLYDQLAGPTNPPATENTSESQYNRFAGSGAGGGTSTVIIQQNGGHTVTNNSVSGGGGRRGSEGVPNTRPTISDWDRRLNSFDRR